MKGELSSPEPTEARPAAKPTAESTVEIRQLSDVPFLGALAALLGSYVLLIVGLLLALASFTSWADVLRVLQSPEIRFATKLSLLTCTLTTLLSLWIAVPGGYLLSRFPFPGRDLVNAIVDIPIVLPPLVIGLALLILFQTTLGRAIETVIPMTFAAPGIVMAQLAVAGAYAIRTMRVTFDQINPRAEHVALTLGCSRAQAFWRVVFPEAWRGILTAGTIVFARSLGEFGPIIVFAGSTRMRTEVLPTTVFLELSIGNIEAAAAVSLLLVIMALVLLGLARLIETRRHPSDPPPPPALS